MAPVVATWSGRGSSSVFRGLLSAVLLVAAIILGLLGMHTLNLHGTPSAEAPAAVAMPVSDTATTPAHHAAAPHGAAQAHPSGNSTNAGDMSCAGCGSDDHAGMAMMCVLALLLALALVIAPGALRAWATTVFRSSPTGALTSRALPQTPSLHVLCISRT
ncbi:hypothetical protein CVS54_01611 [Microbacterium oxydans]|uniref:Uncharacterized protein n=1 Tax=Microbacterium oxydans TaxID=82380 RepID=A0A3Q9J3Q4_9MICO|nr:MULTISPECIES: DUF6153 family protein [Microbacterium]AZS40285.1 hypothetical protein CVS54_01611 [Microbacterium oxydans]